MLKSEGVISFSPLSIKARHEWITSLQIEKKNQIITTTKQEV
jgi:hypothetical protein